MFVGRESADNGTAFDTQCDALVRAIAGRVVSDGALTELFRSWNTIPFGESADCRPQLAVLLDDLGDPPDFLSKALHHLTGICPRTLGCLIIVLLDDAAWHNVWSRFACDFAELERRGLHLRIYFRGDKFVPALSADE